MTDPTWNNTHLRYFDLYQRSCSLILAVKSTCQAVLRLHCQHKWKRSLIEIEISQVSIISHWICPRKFHSVIELFFQLYFYDQTISNIICFDITQVIQQLGQIQVSNNLLQASLVTYLVDRAEEIIQRQEALPQVRQNYVHTTSEKYLKIICNV